MNAYQANRLNLKGCLRILQIDLEFEHIAPVDYCRC